MDTTHAYGGRLDVCYGEQAAYDSAVFPTAEREGAFASILQVRLREVVALSGRAVQGCRSNVASGGDLLMNECIELFLYRA
jgi:hypothetical protein